MAEAERPDSTGPGLFSPSVRSSLFSGELGRGMVGKQKAGGRHSLSGDSEGHEDTEMEKEI